MKISRDCTAIIFGCRVDTFCMSCIERGPGRMGVSGNLVSSQWARSLRGALYLYFMIYNTSKDGQLLKLGFEIFKSNDPKTEMKQ